MAAPKRELYKAGEVCDMLQVQPYVLRSWEAEFPRLGRAAGQTGTRLYRDTDIELVRRIKDLVFGEGLTLAGARRRLEEEEQPAEPELVVADDGFGEAARSQLRAVRSGLRAILGLLDARGSLAPELQLVPPGEPPSRGGGRGSEAVSESSGGTKPRRRRTSA